MSDFDGVTPEEVVKALSKYPDLRFGVAQLILRRMVTPWQGPVTNGVPPNPTQEWYQRGDGIDVVGWKRAYVIEDVQRREKGEPHWCWFISPLMGLKGVHILKEERGHARKRDEAFGECDRRLREAGYCLAGETYDGD